MNYHRSGFDCEILLIANCEFFQSLQPKESQEKEYAIITTPSIPICMHNRNLHRYLKPATTLPISATVLSEVDQAVTAALEREVAMSQSKQGTTVQSKSTMCLARLDCDQRVWLLRCWHSQSLESQCRSKSFVRNH